ncbi:protein of unknown function DUF820 [Candidatus Magnetoovum chiemensis]|nr:protein of unknown function DUF820 [Candidatus Magnetoovum chiemensis]
MLYCTNPQIVLSSLSFPISINIDNTCDVIPQYNIMDIIETLNETLQEEENTALLTYEHVLESLLPEGSYEIIDGQRIDMSPTNFRHGELSAIFAELLRKHFGSKGYIATGEIGIIIKKKPLRLRCADVVYISKETTSNKPTGILEIAPDLVIEIISRQNKAYVMNDKIRDYLSIGVKRIVIVDPLSEIFSTYSFGQKTSNYYQFDEDFPLFEDLSIKINALN